MFKLTHLITVLMAGVAIASPQKLPHADCQVPLGDLDDPVLLASPPIRVPQTKTVLLGYNVVNCSDFEAEYNLVPGTCYFLPGQGANLLYTCGSVHIYKDENCSTGDIILPLHTCYDVHAYRGVKLRGC